MSLGQYGVNSIVFQLKKNLFSIKIAECWQREFIFLESERNTYIYRCLIILGYVLCLPVLENIIIISKLEHAMNSVI